MAFYDRDYQVFVILGSPDVQSLWQWGRWQRAADLIAPLSNLPRGKASVRCHQYVPDPSRLGTKRVQNFGRLAWDLRSHAKWAHGSPITVDKCRDWDFGGMEAWAPSWTACEREHLAPDFYFKMANERVSRAYGKKAAFNPLVILAASLSLDAPYRSSFRAAADALATHVGARLFATRVRPWGYAFGTGGDAFRRAVCDLGAGGGLFRVGNPHERLVDAHTFQEEWRVLA